MKSVGEISRDCIESFISELEKEGFAFSPSGEDSHVGHVTLAEIEHSRFLKDQRARVTAQSDSDESGRLDYLMSSAELPLAMILYKGDQTYELDLLNEKNPFLSDSIYFDKIESIYQNNIKPE